MGKDRNKVSRKSEIDKRTRDILQKSNGDLNNLLSKDYQHLIGELQTYQIELEMQNEELRKAQQELEESRNRYSELYNFAPIGYFTSDTKGIITEINLTGAEMLGVERSKLIKSPFSLYVDPESKEVYHKYLADILKFPKHLAIEIKIVRKHYEPFYAQLESTAVFEDFEKVTQFRTVITDITERKRAEELLLQSEEKFRIITENSADAIFITNEQKKCLYVNKAACNLLGYFYEELAEMSLPNLFPENKINEYSKIFRQFSKTGKLFSEIDLRRKDGSVVSTDLNAVILPNGLVYTSCRDITERKHLEEQLEIRQRMDSIGTLAGGIAHDFNNLLAGIMGNIDLLSLDSEGFSDTQKECLNGAMRSCERAATLIKQFQMLSRGSVTPRTSVDAYEIATDVFNLLERTTDKLIEKKIDFQSGDFLITADPSEMIQVFLNLGTNAVYAIKERGVKKGDYIVIRAEDYTIRSQDITQLPEGEYVHILFEDNGIGMSNDVKRKAFDPLFTTKDKGAQKGQGLGLAMVYNIITRKHSGHIAIESARGKGTTFHIYLPKAPGQKKAAPKKITEVTGGNETILIIEDEEMIGNLAKSSLEKYGYKVRTAPDGRKGLDMYIENMDSIDLVLLDLTMPEMSGEMVLEELLRINPAVKIMISSGHGEEEIREGILLAAKEYVQKPYKVANLAQTVRTVLDS